MGLITTLVNIAKGAWNFITGLPGDVADAYHALWSFIRQVQQLLDYVLSHPLSELLDALAAFAAVVTGNHDALIAAIERIDPWIVRHRVIPLRVQVLHWFAQLRARIAYLFAQAYEYINLKFREAEQYTRTLVDAEHKSMLQHFTAAEHYAYLQALARYQAVEREASDPYNARLKDRLGIAGKLADEIVTRNPAVSSLVKAITAGLVDLLGVEDPLARLALGFVIKHLVDDLSVDKPIAALLSDLLGPILGQPRSRGVADTVGDLADRLAAVEGWQATFMADGGPEILQAGGDWKDLTSLLTDAALLAFTAETIAADGAAAAEVSRILVPVADAAAAAWHDLLT